MIIISEAPFLEHLFVIGIPCRSLYSIHRHDGGFGLVENHVEGLTASTTAPISYACNLGSVAFSSNSKIVA